ncbi:hypothetical protein [Methylobacterium nodulans]
MVNRSLPALTTALGVTATPLVGIGMSSLALGERIDATLGIAAILMVAGIGITAITQSGAPAAATSAKA